MTRRIVATVLASVAGGVILTATPTFAAPDYHACVQVPNHQGGYLINQGLFDYISVG